MPHTKPIRDALLDAFTGVGPRLPEIAASLQDAAEAPPDEDLAATAHQFFNAFEALVVEALEGAGTEKRAFVFETAIPAMVHQGQSPMELLQSHVAFFVVLSHELLLAVADDEQRAAGAWLAGFFAGYVREVTERALQAEREL